MLIVLKQFYMRNITLDQPRKICYPVQGPLMLDSDGGLLSPYHISAAHQFIRKLVAPYKHATQQQEIYYSLGTNPSSHLIEASIASHQQIAIASVNSCGKQQGPNQLQCQRKDLKVVNSIYFNIIKQQMQEMYEQQSK